MSDAKSETQSPPKQSPEKTPESRPEQPKQDGTSTDAVWTEEMMQWAIASSTCGGLPHKDEDEQAAKSAETKTKDSGDDASDKPACP